MKEETKSSEVQIQTVTIKIGKRTLEFSVEEAQNLLKALNGLFGEKVVKEVTVQHEHHYNRPWYWTYPFNYTNASSEYSGYLKQSENIKFDYSLGGVNCSASFDAKEANLCLTVQE